MKYFYLGILFSLFIACDSNDSSEPDLNSAKLITGFSIPDVITTIDQSSKTITFMVSNRKDLTALTPTITISTAASINPPSNTTQDFSGDTSYTVTAEDGTTCEYNIEIERYYSFTFEDHFYEVILEQMNWMEAATFSRNLGGYLTEIDSENEQNKVFAELSFNAGISFEDTLHEFGNSAVWLGGNDINAEGIWVWDGDNTGEGNQFWSGGLDGTPVDGQYNNWGNEPDNFTNQDALTMALETTQRNIAGQWNDLDGENSDLYFVIEYDE